MSLSWKVYFVTEKSWLAHWRREERLVRRHDPWDLLTPYICKGRELLGETLKFRFGRIGWHWARKYRKKTRVGKGMEIRRKSQFWKCVWDSVRNMDMVSLEEFKLMVEDSEFCLFPSLAVTVMLTRRPEAWVSWDGHFLCGGRHERSQRRL